MVSLFVLVIASVLLRGIGWLGVRWFSSWRAAIRAGLAAMFAVTGASHFTSMKDDFVAMIPSPLPSGDWVIYLTGVLEIAGAIGLLIPRLRSLAAVCLAILLVAMFPANVNAALNDIPFRGGPPTPLWIRLPMQVLFLAALWWSSIRQAGCGPR